MEKYQYRVKKASEMTEKEFANCAHLFSMSYGKYRADSPFRPGQQIKMNEAFFERKYKKHGVYIATCTCRNNGTLVGQAVYARRYYDDIGTMTWVMQLVVSDKHRKEGIGSRLLHSIWGFSDDFAWGLATANPCTVKALERATFRKCCPQMICDNLDYIKRFERDIEFVDDIEYFVDKDRSAVNTSFFIDNSEFSDYSKQDEWKLGNLENGYEWLAFTFKNQDMNPKLLQKHFAGMAAFSEEKLKDAYGRMKMPKQKWAQSEKEEINELLNIIPLKDSASILDLGCGTGRHSIELAERGYQVTGIDFSWRNIKKAKDMTRKKFPACKFLTDDARTYEQKEKFDLVLCLFDVIGSFPCETENQMIIHNIYRNLKPGGYAAVSVMNLDYLLERIDRAKKSSFNKDLNRLYELKPGKIMQKTGEIFDPEYMLIDEESGIIYRKEQFEEDEELPAEYLITDKRFRKKEIENIMKQCGFKIIESRYVKAGKFYANQKSEDCKEILLIVKK